MRRLVVFCATAARAFRRWTYCHLMFEWRGQWCFEIRLHWLRLVRYEWSPVLLQWRERSYYRTLLPRVERGGLAG